MPRRPSVYIYTRADHIRGPSKLNWGDYWVKAKLTEAFAMLGHPIRSGPPAAINLFGWGRSPARSLPKRGKNVAWFYSRPEQMTEAELGRYDLVFCTSASYTEAMQDRFRIVHVPVCSYLFGRADPQKIDCPDVVYIGNARRGRGGRPVADFLSGHEELPFSFGIWGVGWSSKNKYWVKRYHPFDRLQDLYASAKVVLVDHYPQMAEGGFLKHQVLDVVAAGGLPLVDRVNLPEKEILWPTYTSQEDALALLTSLTSSDPAVEARRRKVIRAVKPATFIDRAVEMMDEIERRV